MTAQMATAPELATSSTAWRSVFCSDTVASRNRIRPLSSTTATGNTALISQLMRTEWLRGACSETGVAAAFAATPADWSEPVSGIGVQSRQQISDSEEGKHHHYKAQYGEVSCTASTPSAGDAHVQIAGVNQPGDGGPCFLRVPTPV